MHFDDRLATVLRQRTSGDVTARIQYRQLLDLLGTAPVEAQGPQIDAAMDRLTNLSKTIGAGERAAMLREPGVRLRNPRLVAMLSVGEPSVAEAAIEHAHLSEEEWIDLAPALPMNARALVRRRSNLGPRAEALFDQLGMLRQGLPHTPAVIEPEIAAPAAKLAEVTHLPRANAAPANDWPEGIGAIVQRIEDFRKSRQSAGGHAVAGHVHQLPLGDWAEPAPSPKVNAFDFATDTAGRIIWSDPGMAPMAIGLRLAARDAESPAISSPGLVNALRYRQPIHAALIEIYGAPGIAGHWQVDAAPRFDPLSGSFTGYAGRMRRPEMAAAMPSSEDAGDSEADRMRQMLHELRTPVNAVQGFAEIIQQQLFGPTPHEYRALAASIASDAARILAGFEELERLARLETGRQDMETGTCDFADVIAATVAQLSHFTETRSSGFALDIASGAHLDAGIARVEAERLTWRLLATLASASNPGEVLKLHGDCKDGMIALDMQLPASLASQSADELLSAVAGTSSKALSAGMFGTGFTLRLAMAEAQAADGSLQRADDTLLLRLPGLTAAGADHSDGTGSSAAPD